MLELVLVLASHWHALVCPVKASLSMHQSLCKNSKTDRHVNKVILPVVAKLNSCCVSLCESKLKTVY